MLARLAALFLLTASPAALAQPAAPAAVSADGVTLRSASIELPFGDATLPAGQGVDVVTANCTGCHSPGMILTQPQLSPATWTSEVQKMQRTYKAPVDDADVPAIVAYLSALPRPGRD